MIKKDHEGRECALFIRNTDKVLGTDSLAYSANGTKYQVTGGAAPHKPSSTGRVFLTDEDGAFHSFFPSIVNAKWEPCAYITYTDHGPEAIYRSLDEVRNAVQRNHDVGVFSVFKTVRAEKVYDEMVNG